MGSCQPCLTCEIQWGKQCHEMVLIPSIFWYYDRIDKANGYPGDLLCSKTCLQASAPSTHGEGHHSICGTILDNGVYTQVDGNMVRQWPTLQCQLEMNSLALPVQRLFFLSRSHGPTAGYLSLLVIHSLKELLLEVYGPRQFHSLWRKSRWIFMLCLTITAQTLIICKRTQNILT